MARLSVLHLGRLLLLVLLCRCAILQLVDACPGEYGSTCQGEGISGSTMTASCKNANGGFDTTSLDLSEGISNSGGALLCGGSGFSASCSEIGLNGGTTLTATCSNILGALMETSLNLNNCVANQNGVLAFC